MAMSLVALATVLGHVAMFGSARQADEGTAVHIFQVLMIAQVPIIAFFAIKWSRRTPRQALPILALQAGAAFTVSRRQLLEENDMLPPEVRRLIESPNYAHLATLRKDGAPQSIAVWVGLEGERIVIGTGHDTGKAKHTRRNPRVALSITDREDPYKTATIRGHVIEQRSDEDCTVMDVIARKYTGEPFPFRGKGRIALVIEADEARYTELPFTHRPG